ncbi:transcriptional repressor [Demequina sp. TTPB684]|uniref:Fur family transcriptional regulator n=1 Tax=unclassified Demequina TaxID=2620311 RepID=UPI001CF1C908|nr:Fur family transcriptional regulator [Demequina sp. TMPB413]MCB2413301.1 transcriptional repressor [Demequina sp. TTPB684]UPU88979.1 transcriptional repressor [Demequina sp. TMPB413]
MTDAPPRMTKQRTAVLAVLKQGGFRSAQDWHDRLRHSGSSAGLATVYRALQALAETGDVDAVVTESGETLYRLCEARETHHHHLRCRACGAAEDIDMPSIEVWASKVGAERGYSQIDHTVELTGVCSECTAKDL